MAQLKNNTSLEKQVRGAIRKLTNDGTPITNQTVRDEIGGGSFRDIGPLVKQIKTEIAAKEQAERATPEVPEDFRDASAAMWETAWRLADDVATSERHAHAEELERLKGEADEALSNCGLVEDERDKAEKRGEELAKQLAETEAVLMEMKLEIARLNGQLTEREELIESKLATICPVVDAQTLLNEGELQDSENVNDNASQTNPDVTQLDMFSNNELSKNKPADPEPIAAE